MSGRVSKCWATVLTCVVGVMSLPCTVRSDDLTEIPNTQQGEPLTARQAAESFDVPHGFEVTLFAGEPDVQQPIAMTTDERGRLWVVENYTYAELAVNFESRLQDRIVILEDADGDGEFDERTVFWEAPAAGLSAESSGTRSPVRLTSVEVGFGGIWVLGPPYLMFLPDRDRDDVPDGPPEILLDGWNDDAVRHNIANGLKWGPDGWLYGRHGILANSLVGPPGSAPSERTRLNCAIWRYHPTRKVFEVVAHGTTNSWGFDYDRHGEMFFINTVIGHLWHLLPGAHYRRMYGADFNPHVYELIDQTADHVHWDTGEKWSDIRAGISDTTSQAGGGHAHSGLMIYLGDNWPNRYRNKVFTINFHGRRLNVDHLHRHGSGYVATHSDDMLFADNEWFRGIDLIYGPDGGVFVADWSDIGECHENDGVHRTSGRIYKVTYGKPNSLAADDLSTKSDVELVALQSHRNAWFARQARRLLQERAAAGRDMAEARTAAQQMFGAGAETTHILGAMWCLHAMQAVDADWLCAQLDHADEHVRVWAVRLLMDRPEIAPDVAARLAKRAAVEQSGLVRTYLAAALGRIPIPQRWELAAELIQTDADDEASKRATSKNVLPLMIWYGIEPAVPVDMDRAIQLAETSGYSLVRRHIARRITADLETNPQAVDRLLQTVGRQKNEHVRFDLLQGMAEALRGWRKADSPESWPLVAAELKKSTPPIRQLARQLGIVFGDGRALDELQTIVMDVEADVAARRGALRALAEARSPHLLPLLKRLLSDAALAEEVIRGFASFDSPDIPGLILGRYANLDADGQAAVIDTLTSRSTYAASLLEAVERGLVDRNSISAYHARQIRAFDDDALNRRLARIWGTVRETDAAKRQLMALLRAKLSDEQLASADLAAGRIVFHKACANCHVLYGSGTLVGPDLTGSNRHNLDYLLENIVDPSASVGKEFQVSVVALDDGRIVTGVVIEQTPRTVTVQTEKERLTIDRNDILEMNRQHTSLMPDGLLSSMSDAQIRNLFAYLRSRSQVELPENTVLDAGE